MRVLNKLLKDKVVQLKDYSAEPLVNEELTELSEIISDTESNIEERILAARVMLNVSENRLIRAKRQVSHWTKIHSELVHSNEKEKARVNLQNQVMNKLGATEDTERFLEALLAKIRKQ